MKAYIAIGLKSRQKLDPEIQVMQQVLSGQNIAAFIFVDKYHFKSDQEKEMMQQAMTDISNCDLLIAEVSEKAVGVGIEVGYAKGQQKPVIYLRQASAEHSTTASGISDYSIVYSSPLDLGTKLRSILAEVLKPES